MPNVRKRRYLMQMYQQEWYPAYRKSDAWHGLLIASKIGIPESVKMRAASEEFS